MSEPKHSPAPFGVIATKSGYFIIDKLGDSIGALAGSTGDHPPEEQQANAYLFGAAPDLLRTLKLLVATQRPKRSSDPVRNVIWDTADAVIRRAETGQGLKL